MAVRFASYNVCFPLWAHDASRSLNLISENFDVVALQEADQRYCRSALAHLGSAEWGVLQQIGRDNFNTTAVLYRKSVAGDGVLVQHSDKMHKWCNTRCLRGKTVVWFPKIKTLVLSAWLGHGDTLAGACNKLNTRNLRISDADRGLKIVYGADTNLWQNELSGATVSITINGVRHALQAPETAPVTGHREKYFWTKAQRTPEEVVTEMVHTGDYVLCSESATPQPLLTEQSVEASDHLPVFYTTD